MVIHHSLGHVISLVQGKKKRSPQEEWMDIISEAADEISSKKGSYSQVVANNVVKMSQLGNVPRNEKKFKNYVKNSLRVSGEQQQ